MNWKSNVIITTMTSENYFFISIYSMTILITLTTMTTFQKSIRNIFKTKNIIKIIKKLLGEKIGKEKIVIKKDRRSF